MFTIRQALRLCPRLACARYSSVYYGYTPIASELNGIAIINQSRFIHKSVINLEDINKLEGKIKLMFTCKKCQTRNSKVISKLAYNKGVIIVRCDGCKNNHLIADNLGWFSGNINNKINIEKIMKLKGETVRKITNDMEGYYEAVANEEFNLKQDNTSNVTKENNSTHNDKCSTETKKIGVSNES